MEEQIGAIIEQGPEDWQIVQQDERGEGRIELEGRWKFETPGQVEVRLVWEDTGVAVAAGLDWQAVHRQRKMELGKLCWNTSLREGFTG